MARLEMMDQRQSQRNAHAKPSGTALKHDAPETLGHGSKSRTPSEHPNPTTKIGSKMDGAPNPQNGLPLVLTITAT